MRRPPLALILAAVLGISALGYFAFDKMSLPKPQAAFADGQLTPDFTLKDQAGNPFHLADLRGQRVLLVFYRGYW